MFKLRKALIGAGVLVAAGMAASAASAAPGYVTNRTSLLAGPGGQYPVVARIGSGDRVEIFGCLQGWNYCDVAWRGVRGWARGSALQVFYRERRASLYQYAPVIGIPFVSFSIGNYWGSHYNNQPWYNQAWRWGGPRDRDRDRDRDNDRPRMGSNPGVTYQGNNNGYPGNGSGNVERRYRDLQGNTNNGGPKNEPRVRDNRRGNNKVVDGPNGINCGPGSERQGGGCVSNR